MNQNDRLDTQTTDCDDNNSTAQDREIERLLEIIDREIEKPDEEIDYALIEECTARLDALTPLEKPYTEEEIEKNLQKLKDSIKEAEKSAKILSAPVANRWNRPWIKAASAIAACFIVCFSSLSIVAKTQGYDSTWEFVVTNARKIAGMDPGEQTTEDKISIVKFSGTNTYSSIQELVEKENLPILYPTKLPEGLKINKIIQLAEKDQSYSLHFVFSKKDYDIKISSYLTEKEYPNDEELYEQNGIVFHIVQKDSSVYLGITEYNGYEYTIRSTNYNDLIDIISNMKGF